MANKRVARKQEAARDAKIRVSVGFSPEDHDTVGKLAKKMNVSFGWVVRDAVQKYLADKWPLFAGK